MVALIKVSAKGDENYMSRPVDQTEKEVREIDELWWCKYFRIFYSLNHGPTSITPPTHRHTITSSRHIRPACFFGIPRSMPTFGEWATGPGRACCHFSILRNSCARWSSWLGQGCRWGRSRSSSIFLLSVNAERQLRVVVALALPFRIELILHHLGWR